MSIAVLGDVGGQTQVFVDALLSIGVDPNTGIIPEEMTLIQVGDIVRMNPHPDLDSLGCAELADKLLMNNPGRYIQLLGNHEYALLGGSLDPHWKIDDLPESRPIVEKWWNNKEAVLSVALRSKTQPDEDILITHAGLGYNYWNSIGAGNAEKVSKTLNSFVGTDIPSFENPGWLVKREINTSADTAWALVGLEFHETWNGHIMPFNQIHGHAALMQWEIEEFWPDVLQHIIDSTDVDMVNRFTLTKRPDGRWVRSVDWVLGNASRDFNWPVLVLSDYEVI